jgi:hypothetical protein
MSYKPEVQVVGESTWDGNSLRFATFQEADTYAADLAMRWTAVKDIRVTESTDPVNYAIIDKKVVPIA